MSDLRLPQAGSALDRGRPLHFSFDGRAMIGFAGDTLASALFANGVRTVARSFKYHRRRGILGAGCEEPNALVTVGEGRDAVPNIPATLVPLCEGLTVRSQNRWPSLGIDLGALNNVMARFLPAGFYYKTFMAPQGAWTFYEHLIRRAAGHGRLSGFPDRQGHEMTHLQCDLLVVGTGPAGLSAAIAAAENGSDVVLCGQSPRLGGGLAERPGARIADSSPADWLAQREEELRRLGVRILTHTTVIGVYDHHDYLAVRHGGWMGQTEASGSASTLYRITAPRTVLATGAIERPLVFANNDLPGIMLASAACRYAAVHGVAAGRRVVLACTSDDGWESAIELYRLGVNIVAIVDSRPADACTRAAEASAAGILVKTGCRVVLARGKRALKSVRTGPVDTGGGAARDEETIPCDALLTSAGRTPTVHLHSQLGWPLIFSDELGAFIAPGTRGSCVSIGAAAGVFDSTGTIQQAAAAGAGELTAASTLTEAPALSDNQEGEASIDAPRSAAAGSSGAGKSFVDLQNDVTVDDLALAVREGYESVEHVKRYTTLGMGTDQGKTSAVNALHQLARIMGKRPEAVGTTTFRPPYTPAALGALAGGATGKWLRPLRRTPMHAWQLEHGAVMDSEGQWERPKYYAVNPGEAMAEAAEREALATRGEAGITDVSTLGKFDVVGPDAEAFLDRIYANRITTLKVGRCRYCLMLREDGVVLDDGTVSRVGEHHFYLTSSTAGAAHAAAHLQYHLQVMWPEMRVAIFDGTDQWGAFAVAGPRSRDVLAHALEPDSETVASLSFLDIRELGGGEAPVRVLRLSFSGELAYEVHAPFAHCLALWTRVIENDAGVTVTPYGTEALDIMRIEKGFLTGNELDGRKNPHHIGCSGLLKADKRFVGNPLVFRSTLSEEEGPRLVGLRPVNADELICAGAQLLDASPDERSLGYVSSVCYSPTLKQSVALGFLSAGSLRHGEEMTAVSWLEGRRTRVRISGPCHLDVDAERMRT